jgi:hypothetical protein
VADELLEKKFDRELWQSGDELVVVHRPRTSAVTAMAGWFTFAGFATLGAIGALVGIAMGQPWWLEFGGLAAVAVVLFFAAMRARARDLKIRAMPIRQVDHVAIRKGEVTLANGTKVGRRDIRLEVVKAEYGDAERLELVLHAGERNFIVTYGRTDQDLDRAREHLRRAGLGPDKFKKQTA